MLNFIWLFLVVSSVLVGLYTGHIPEVVAAVTSQAKFAIEIALGLVGLLSFWLGIMKLAEAAGLVYHFARALKPLMRRLFPEVPVDHPAMGSMLLNMAANILGLGNAATPFGLRAMEELNQLNKFPGTASNAMCTFLAINTSSIQLIPATAIAYLVMAGASHPALVIVSSLFATTCSTIAAVVSVKLLEKLKIFDQKRGVM